MPHSQLALHHHPIVQRLIFARRQLRKAATAIDRVERVPEAAVIEIVGIAHEAAIYAEKIEQAVASKRVDTFQSAT